MGAAIGDTFTCFRKHENAGAVSSGTSKLGMGRDLDDAVLAATNRMMGQAGGGLVSLVSLSFQCSSLPNLDTFTRTDGMCVLFKKEGNVWKELGKTEVIMDSLDPKWVKNFEVPYHFEKREFYKVVVFDIDDFNNLNNFDGHDLVGSMEFEVHEVVGSVSHTLERRLECAERTAGQSGSIKVIADEKEGMNNEEANFNLSGNFAQGDGFNFFFVHKSMGPNNFKPIYKSEITSQLNGRYSWTLVSLLTSELANEDPEREIRFEFFKSQKSGKHINLGYFGANIAQLREGQIEFDLIGRTKNQKVRFDNLQFHKRHTFLEYIFGGCEIQLSVAIDFTLSNGDPSDRDSLHYLDMSRNEYLNVIRSVGNTLQYYDSDKQIPVLGFGATVPPSTNRASHCFALNGNIFDPEVDGLEGVVEAYKNALKNVNLYGPTNFAPIIELINDLTEAEQVDQVNQKYNILLIITDGIINDMQKTIDQIVRGSSLPLSIIIVGVGSDDFESMDILDADDVPLYSQRYKKNMDADIVQFVPFREFRNNPAELAKQTLEEVPGQLMNFMKKRNIVPMPATEAGRRAIQQKLSRQRSIGLGQSQKQPEADFFGKRKEAFIQKMIDMGMDYAALTDFLEERCIHEENPELVLDYMNDPSYVNPLKMNFLQAPNPHAQLQQHGYGYMPDARQQVQMPFSGWMNPGQQQQQQQQQMNHAQMPHQQQPQMHGKILPGIGNNNRGMVNPAQMMGGGQQLLNNPGAADDTSCKVCMDKKINTVCVPCGHQVLCDNCAKVINKTCPICNQPVQQVIKTYG